MTERRARRTTIYLSSFYGVVILRLSAAVYQTLLGASITSIFQRLPNGGSKNMPSKFNCSYPSYAH